MSVKAIDVSYCQPNVDYDKVKSAGIDAVIIRAGFGRETYQKDSEFETHYRNSRAAGLKVGAYWYSYAESVTDAITEAEACLACVRGKSFDYPIYYDMEEQSIANLGVATCTNMAKAFCDKIIDAGYKAGVYANPNWFSNYLDYDDLHGKYSIWLAQWSNNYSYDCDIWQYASNGHIPGVSGNVDMDIIIREPSGGASEPAASDTREPSNGSSDIEAVQDWLNDNYGTGLDIDGIYGNLTKSALVKALQTELNKQCGAGLVVDGIFGWRTRAAIVNLYSGVQGNLTKTLQGLLICNGYDTNGFDGIFGAGTSHAVQQYQSDHGLYVDGIAGKDTFERLCS